jgi:hypothetical protein
MKKLLLLAFICTFTFTYAQQRSFIKKHLYIKAAPTLMGASEISENLRLKGFPTPAIFGALGAKTRYVALGFSAGYFKMDGEAGKKFTPLGIDLTITDFKRKKAFPVLTAQWYKINYKDEYTIGRGGSYGHEISGKDMRSIGAGMAFEAFKTAKIMATLSYSRLSCDTRLSSRNPFPPQGDPNLPTYRNTKDRINFVALALGWMF